MLLIDGDLYVYKAGFAHRKHEQGFKLINRNNQEEVDLGKLSHTSAIQHLKDKGYKNTEWKLTPYYEPVELGYVLGNLKESLNGLMSQFGGNPPYEMYLTSTDKSNFRYNIATITPYKGSRARCIKCYSKTSSRYESIDDNFMGIGALKQIVVSCSLCGDIPKEQTQAERPYYYDEIREYLIKHWGAVVIYGQEADDELGIRATEIRSKGDNCTMVHVDKDIDNVPGSHYNPNKGETYYLTEEESLRHFYTQFLLGDNVDNIPGVNGAGPIAAKKLLEGCITPEDYEEVILAIYQGETFSIPRFKNNMELNQEEAFNRLQEIGQLLWIRRKENEMWKPTIIR